MFLKVKYKRKILFVVVIACLIITGCNKKEDLNNNIEEKNVQIDNYLPKNKSEYQKICRRENELGDMTNNVFIGIIKNDNIITYDIVNVYYRTKDFKSLTDEDYKLIFDFGGNMLGYYMFHIRDSFTTKNDEINILKKDSLLDTNYSIKVTIDQFSTSANVDLNKLLNQFEEYRGMVCN